MSEHTDAPDQDREDIGPGDGGEHAPEDGASERQSGWTGGSESAAISALEDELRGTTERLQRALAEMENLRRRTEREKSDIAKYAISDFARDVLGVSDNIGRAIDAVPPEAAQSSEAVRTLLEGVEMTDRALQQVLERHGIERLHPEGDRFDPNWHQAMFEIDNPEVPSGTVLQVIQTGYRIGDRVLRPAMVGVSKGGPRPSKADPAPTAANDDAPSDTHGAGSGWAQGAEDSGGDGEDGAPGRDDSLGGRVDTNA